MTTKQPETFETVGELKALLEQLPDDMPAMYSYRSRMSGLSHYEMGVTFRTVRMHCFKGPSIGEVVTPNPKPEWYGKGYYQSSFTALLEC